MRRLLAVVLAVATQGCLALPPTSAERLNQAAFQLNSATRFGRMDVAADSVATEARMEFGKRHRRWGRDIRIVDLELEGVEMISSEAAQVAIVISWHRLNDPTIEATSITQRWVQSTADWRLAEETVTNGSSGLFPPVSKTKDQVTRKRAELVGSVDLP